MVDPIVSAAKTDIGSLEARVKLLETKAETWIQRNWPHLITWAGVAWAVIKHL